MDSPIRNCTSCGVAVPDDAAHCPSCGAPTPDPRRDRRPVTPDAASDRETDFRSRLQAALGEGFELGELIGRGGIGAVYAAWDRELERDVAVKALRFDLVLTPDLLARFKREARAVAQLRHPYPSP
jgi:serine/threonine-protein kinase